MKKIYILTIMVIWFFPRLEAQDISIDSVIIVANNFFSKESPNRSQLYYSIDLDAINDTVLLYCVNYDQGGWVILSSDKSTKPVLAYSPNGKLDMNGSQSPSLRLILKNYRDQVMETKRQKYRSASNIQKWDLLYNNYNFDYRYSRSNNKKVAVKKSSSTFSYTVGEILLGGGTSLYEPEWGQTVCNTGGCWSCDIDYNEYIESCSGGNCVCGHYSAGCGAVAFGQILYYWKFPNKVNDSYYDWELIPQYIDSSTASIKAEHLARLIQDIGSSDVINMHYWSTGSWTLVGAIEDGFENIGFTASKKDRTFYSDATWIQMLKDEIDACRPVLYKGEDGLLSAYKHYWVVDGYDSNDLFHLNLGWNGSSNGWFSIDNIYKTGWPANYNTRQNAIIGISPNCSFLPDQINSTTFQTINQNTGLVHLQAESNISLPSTGTEIETLSGGRLVLSAGGSVTLKPGFSAVSGSYFRGQIITCGSTRYGEISAQKSLNLNSENSVSEIINNNLDDNNKQFEIYPNPNYGEFTISYPSKMNIQKIEVYDINGRKLENYSFNDTNRGKIVYNTDDDYKGMIIVKIITENTLYSKLVIIK